MAITRKPSPSPGTKKVDVDALINKGGSAPGETTKKEHDAKDVPVLIRIPADLLERIDALVAGRQPRQSRHTWLLEALFEKVSREEAQVLGRNP